MHSSSFSYNVSRSYPFKWFTPVVFVGGIVISVLVSFLSIATSGYQFVATSSADPNSTVSSHIWFDRWSSPPLIGTIQPICQSATISLNSVLYTNNSALAYTLTDVWQESNTSALADTFTGVLQDSDKEGRLSFGSLVYHNNPLRNCHIRQITISFEGFQRPPHNIATQQQGALVNADTICWIETPSGLTGLRLTAAYDYLPDVSLSEFASFRGRNSTTQASLYWGESLLYMYWVLLTNNLHQESQDAKFDLFKGDAQFNLDHDAPSDESGVKSLDFFSIRCWFLSFSERGISPNATLCSSNNIAQLAYNTSAYPFSSIWIPADSISKALYYTVLADLGQANSSYPNLLTDPELLEYFNQNFTSIVQSIAQGVRPYGENVGLDAGLATVPYVRHNSSQYQLNIHPSTLATNYLCQVPQLKAMSSLIVAVLIADLVLLQTIWRVFKLCIDTVLVKRHPEMKYCEGCLQTTKDTSLHRSEKALEEHDNISEGGFQGAYAKVEQAEM